MSIDSGIVVMYNVHTAIQGVAKHSTIHGQDTMPSEEVCSEITFCPQSIPDCPQILPLGLLIPQKKFHRPTPSGNSGSGHAHFFAYYLYR